MLKPNKASQIDINIITNRSQIAPSIWGDFFMPKFVLEKLFKVNINNNLKTTK